jgi:glycosyltransferase involved in cell wall biosynthesis
MKIIQMLPTMAYGDAIGNHTLALNQMIKNMGYNTEIYAEAVDQRLPSGIAKEVKKMHEVNDEDVVLYHLSTGSELNYYFGNLKCRKIVEYHNITPPSFFSRYNSRARINAQKGIEQARWLANKVDYCLADSDFNRTELKKMGYEQRIDVAPILIPFSDYEKKPSEVVFEKYNDGKINILFTGRIAPNKKQEDIIEAFYYYKRNINANSRLIFVGSYNGMERYYNMLTGYAEELNLKDVEFTGHIPFNEILAYYKIADVFVCMSEHEGFCVPLVEAMKFEIPILAFANSAIPETMGNGGILLKEKEPKITAEWIDQLTKSSELCDKIRKNQRQRLTDFQYDKIAGIYERHLKKFIEG